ncbi:MAG: Asp-tRNA(Asn)/Glu-tRNA(Gln) amidotransferase subunit GatC [Actinobacteria bacterium]|nr:Asp-tRNA(Asn)/Glu-tRNA(Gln) amidotransferase subunit GatC [Actinomycetota bacterium]NBY15706.1 Asp-tRNA(Asn)/Glu-tRNA(Gln) amidotransferase subunit GatC [Actinomycetota bacterium]
MSEISSDDVSHLAKLARIEIPEEQLAHYAQQLDAILDAVAQVASAPTQDVPAMSHPVPMTNVFRADVPAQSLTAEQALAGAPCVEDDRFRVPRILDEE